MNAITATDKIGNLTAYVSRSVNKDGEENVSVSFSQTTNALGMTHYTNITIDVHEWLALVTMVQKMRGEIAMHELSAP